MRQFEQAGIYLVTSQTFSAGRSTPEVVLAALRGGIRLVQLREKDIGDGALFRLAVEVRELTHRYGALLLINDRLDIALAAGADGVHLGRTDLPVSEARRLAPDMVIGASSHSLGDAREAQDAGASYVNIGPVFPTNTKERLSNFLGMEGVRAIASHLNIPFTVMGGIKAAHIHDLVACDARTIAVVTAITAAADPESASRELLEVHNRCIHHVHTSGRTQTVNQ
jgi:thiamine-phosphate pyrophosphorylase